MQNDLPIDELLRRARAGDSEALAGLVGRYREFVRLLVRSRCGGRLQARIDSSDLIQETLLRVSRHIDQFQGNSEEEWRAWLSRIAEREVIGQLRHHLGAARRDVAREQPLAAPSSSNGASRLEQWWAKSQSSPSQAAMRQERVLALTNALGRLPDDYREVLVLRHLEGLGFAEIADRLNRSEGAVRVLWTRALKRLRDELIGSAADTGATHHD
ncbi:MAG: sigma-70 family RNA polymerase sigma factor [Gemmataceae bacterium]|nr:sigma-70 family RNA polymerase sigma factor [Gemmataceae bacterium]